MSDTENVEAAELERLAYEMYCAFEGVVDPESVTARLTYRGPAFFNGEPRCAGWLRVARLARERLTRPDADGVAAFDRLTDRAMFHFDDPPGDDAEIVRSRLSRSPEDEEPVAWLAQWRYTASKVGGGKPGRWNFDGLYRSQEEATHLPRNADYEHRVIPLYADRSPTLRDAK